MVVVLAGVALTSPLVLPRRLAATAPRGAAVARALPLRILGLERLRASFISAVTKSLWIKRVSGAMMMSMDRAPSIKASDFNHRNRLCQEV